MTFFETPRPVEKKSSQSQITKDNENSITPTIDSSINIKKISREDSILNSERVKIENDSIQGSLSLRGGLVDDISFKKHKKNLKDKKNVEFLNPAELENGFYIEAGWTSVGNKIKVPTKESLWKIGKNKSLNENQNINLQWDNGEGIIFKRSINLDNNYLFKITQEVQNNTNKEVELYPYAQITRNKVPDDIQNFYISHEGFIGVFDDELKEDDYDDIKENKIVRESNKGWLGITDKYWMTALVPSEGQYFKSTFLFKNGFKANYIVNNPKIIKPASSNSNDLRLFVAKEVETIDAYAA